MTVYLGIDWSESKHDVCVLNAAGGMIATCVIAHSQAGFAQLEALRRQLDVPAADCWVGLETAQTLLIDYLWTQGYTQIYVIPPHAIKSARERYRHSGAHNDTSDSFVIADTLRTDHARWAVWHPDGPLSRQLRVLLSLSQYLLRQELRWAGRLRAVLLRYYPAALTVFGSLRSQITLQFVCAYPTPQVAAALSETAFKAFARQHHYPRRTQLRQRFESLQAAQPQATAETVLSYQAEALCLAQVLLSVVRARARVVQQMGRLFRQHPDYAIFSSLPGIGRHLGPALPALFGEDRQRFPTAESVQALAGTCPITIQSGRRRVVRFRRACDRQFRQVVQQWARASLKKSEWARGYWAQVRPRCDSDNHAYRCLGNRWLAIAWKLWQTHQSYDAAYHLRQRAQRHKPKPAR